MITKIKLFLMFLILSQLINGQNLSTRDQEYVRSVLNCTCASVSYVTQFEQVKCRVSFKSNRLNYQELTKIYGDILCDGGGILPPALTIEKMDVSIGDKKIEIPLIAYTNLFFDGLRLGEKNMSSIWLSKNENNEYIINFNGGDASRSYSASIVISDNKILRREFILLSEPHVKYIQSATALMSDKLLNLKKLKKIHIK